MSSEQCPFCAIVAGDDPDVREVYRNEHVVAFFPTQPAVLGHVLVVPRRHVEDIWGLRPEESAELSTAAVFISTALRAALLPEGLNVIQSNGEAATQTVPHLHVHLVPRRSGDVMGPIWPPETDFTEASKHEAFRRVIDAIQSTPPAAQPELTPEDRRKHLDYIQAVVTRQSAASSSAKGWLLPVTTAAFGFALTQHLWPLALLGVIAVILFAYLDANYLRSEKAFRKLYNTVARAERMVPRFTLDPTDADEPPADGTPEKTKWQKFKQSYVPEWSVWRSWSIAPFYVAMLVLGIGVLIAAAVTRPAPASTHENPEPPPAATQTTVSTASVPVPTSVPVTPRP